MYDKKNCFKVKLATLEEAEVAAAEVAIRTGLFSNKASLESQADLNGEWGAGSLEELQEEVKALDGQMRSNETG